MSLIELIEQSAAQLESAGAGFGHGTTNAFDEAAWLVLWQLGLPLDTPLDGQTLLAKMPVGEVEQAQVAVLLEARIVPRSFIAELLVDGTIDAWLGEETHRVLDLCTGNGSLAVLAAMAYPDVAVDASDISGAALEVAQINVNRHALQHRINVLKADGLPSQTKPYDLILCNPPYVNAKSMGALPAEYQAEPALALDGNRHGGSDGMDFIRILLHQAPAHLTVEGVLVLEIGNERRHFEAAFPRLDVVWLPTSAGTDQVLLVTAAALQAPPPVQGRVSARQHPATSN